LFRVIVQASSLDHSPRCSLFGVSAILARWRCDRGGPVLVKLFANHAMYLVPPFLCRLIVINGACAVSRGCEYLCYRMVCEA